MTFYDLLERVLALLQRHQRLSYRALKLQFPLLDPAYLGALGDELLACAVPASTDVPNPGGVAGRSAEPPGLTDRGRQRRGLLQELSVVKLVPCLPHIYLNSAALTASCRGSLRPRVRYSRARSFSG